MAKRPQSSKGDSSRGGKSGEVVRLPVDESDLSDKLDPLPTQAPRAKMPRSQGPGLVDEDPEELVVPPPESENPWDTEENLVKQTPVGWIGLIGVILILLGIWAMAKLAKGEAHIDEEAGEVEELKVEDERREFEAQHLLEAIAVELKKYVAADEVEKKANFVRHRERVLPLMRDYYERHELKAAELGAIYGIRPVTIENRPFVYLHAQLDGSRSQPFVIEQLPGGTLKFDWESQVAYQPMPLGEYIAAKPTEPMAFRIYAKLDDFYAFEFADSNRYRAFYIAGREGEDYLFGYTERGSEADRKLVEPLSKARGGGLPFLLRLRFLPGTPSIRSVLVEEVIAPRWTYGANPEGQGVFPYSGSPRH